MRVGSPTISYSELESLYKASMLTVANALAKKRRRVIFMPPLPVAEYYENDAHDGIGEVMKILKSWNLEILIILIGDPVSWQVSE